ncbi:zf-CCHC domain-containing protein [Tanacetum coccineum]
MIPEGESIDNAFARFNTIITSLKELDEVFSSKNYIRKFLRALHPKWRAKVTAIEESKDLTSLSLDESIGNLKVYEVIIKKDSKIVKGKREQNKSLALKAKKESSDEESFGCGDPRPKCFGCGDPNHLIRECSNPSRNKNQSALVGRSWSDSGEDEKEKVKDQTCLMPQASNEICLGINLESDEWIKDSECFKHMTGNRNIFSTYKAYNGGNAIFESNLRGNIIGKVEESLNVTFDETPPPPKTSPLEDDDLVEEDAIKEMLKKFGLEDSKPMKTPMSSDTKLTKDEEVLAFVHASKRTPKPLISKRLNVSSDTLKAIRTWDYGILRGPA